MSTDGSVGEPTRSSTLSYNEHGRPIPALNQPQQIFDRLFGAGDADTARQARRLKSGGSLLDLVLEDAARSTNLDKYDQQKLTNVRYGRWNAVWNGRKSGCIPGRPDMPTVNGELESDLGCRANTWPPCMSCRLSSRIPPAWPPIRSPAWATPPRSAASSHNCLAWANTCTHCHGWNREDGIEPLGKWTSFLPASAPLSCIACTTRRYRRARRVCSITPPLSTAAAIAPRTITRLRSSWPAAARIGFQHGQYVVRSPTSSPPCCSRPA